MSVDAFHQGGSPTLGSLAYLPRWVQLDILEAAAIAILAAAAVARRLGPVTPGTTGPGRSTAEMVRSLASMHRSAGRPAGAARPLLLQSWAAPGSGGAACQPSPEAALHELESAASPGAAVRACVRIEEITRRVTGGDR